MADIVKIIADELNVLDWQVQAAMALRADGATIPFIARYRKEKTGELDEVQIRSIFERADYLSELAERKVTILNSINEQGKLTEELKTKIDNTLSKSELEDLYLPYKPKRRTRGIMAQEKGLAPLAAQIKNLNTTSAPFVDLQEIAARFISKDKEIESAKDALAGAADIIAEEIAETAELRAWLRDFFAREAEFHSVIKPEFEPGTTKYETYRDFSVRVRDIKPHAMLAMRRAEAEKVLAIEFKFDDEKVLNYLGRKLIFTRHDNMQEFYTKTIKDAFNRLMKHSIIGEVRLEKKKQADEESVKVFESNLRQLLLAPPAGRKPTLGIDPGIRTGCKVAVVDETGKFIENTVVYPFEKSRSAKSANAIQELINKYDIAMVAIGNGTAGRETFDFVEDITGGLNKRPVNVLVNEAGASVYSASAVAADEFPDLDLTVRGAISIARRLQDPLAELVKIDPKSIGVGQYQHDVDQKLLKKRLEDTVESCVNYVGVDLNLASKELLSYVSGLSKRVASNILQWRNENGAFHSRKDLMNVPMFGEKAFQQAAGFLRIPGGTNLLDNTAVHPESYGIVSRIASDNNLDIAKISGSATVLTNISLDKYVSSEIGLPTLNDIIDELKKPGRDPRKQFKYAEFDSQIKEIKDVPVGIVMEGVVTNITNFGAFVDIGVHQDGLVHISEIANRYINHPSEFLHVGQIVRVKVLDVNIGLKRIGLSIKQVQE